MGRRNPPGGWSQPKPPPAESTAQEVGKSVKDKEEEQEENGDDEMRAQATLKQGVCFYEARLYGKCFKVFRKIIEDFPASEEVNRAYYYIGLGHFKQGHYSRAIESLEKVGTAFSEKEKGKEKVEAGKRLFVKIEDADLAILAQEDSVEILC